MGKYTITDEILMRYHSGRSSAAECAAVEAWLEDAEEEVISSHDQGEEDEVNTALWASLEQSTIFKERKRQQLKLWYKRISIAASLLIALPCVFLLYKSVLRSDRLKVIQIDNFKGQTAKEENIDGLVFTALTFCDAMLIQNKSVEDVSLNFASNSSGIDAQTKKFVCKSGITYVALRISRISPEIIVVDQRYMEDVLPLNVAMRINKDLQAI
ncbi:MAG: hypothetical protein WC623_19770 [Pedobacter sp.]|uniref:hypothetical protein n=1 Tax=Pedobacter sp. TaxID=1411316 RepID=UPI0035655627